MMDTKRPFSLKCLRAWLLALFVILSVITIMYPFYGASFTNWLDGRAVYQGLVIDDKSGMPVPNAEVRGSYELDTDFVPTLDGIFLSKTVTRSTTTDANGRFMIELEGSSRRLTISNGYSVETVNLWGIEPSRQITVRLADLLNKTADL